MAGLAAALGAAGGRAAHQRHGVPRVKSRQPSRTAALAISPATAGSLVGLGAFGRGERLQGVVEPRIGNASRGGQDVPLAGLDQVLRQPPPRGEDARHAVLRHRIALLGGAQEQLRARGLVLRDAVAVEQHDGILDLGRRDAVLRGQRQPLRRLGQVARHAAALLVEHAHRVLRLGLRCIRRPAEQLDGPLVALGAALLQREKAQIVGRRRHLGRRPSRAGAARRPGPWPCRGRPASAWRAHRPPAHPRAPRRGDTIPPLSPNPGARRSRSRRVRPAASSPPRPWGRPRCAWSPRRRRSGRARAGMRHRRCRWQARRCRAWSRPQPARPASWALAARRSNRRTSDPRGQVRPLSPWAGAIAAPQPARWAQPPAAEPRSARHQEVWPQDLGQQDLGQQDL